MLRHFVPEFYFDAFDMASAEFLASIGVKGIVLDVDNTLEPYENPVPSEHVLAWFESLRCAGIKAAIVSNNNWERINTFNADLKIPAYAKAGKPFSRNIINALRDMEIDKSEAIMMGDQVFTDVWAAHNAGIRAILVPPINDKKDILTRFKRMLEIPVLKAYKRRVDKQ